MGPGGIMPGSYDPQSLTQEQRNWLFNYFGNQGEAPVGYGGEGMYGPRGDIATGIAFNVPEVEPVEMPPLPEIPPGPSPEEIAQQLLEEMWSPVQEALDRAKQFDEENPFVFDEELARASASERYDPYYEAELSDFVGGIERTRRASVQDERRVLGEISAQTQDYLGSTKRELDRAIEASQRGFAGAGLFFSGERRRAEGQLEVEDKFQREEFLRKQGYRADTARISKERTLQDLLAQQQRGQRLMTAEREAALQVDIEQQRKEEQARRELERQQFIGYPLSGGAQAFTNLSQYL